MGLYELVAKIVVAHAVEILGSAAFAFAVYAHRLWRQRRAMKGAIIALADQLRQTQDVLRLVAQDLQGWHVSGTPPLTDVDRRAAKEKLDDLRDGLYEAQGHTPQRKRRALLAQEDLVELLSGKQGSE